ncbi:hypothetical protein ACOACO_17570 [Nocardioides sp. CPCC 205120]|uniref:hypothetical protein n=1 Tax=Nocardioides sp. CPCC 205120 TaxID=3406462 RepID=UPI003B509F93
MTATTTIPTSVLYACAHAALDGQAVLVVGPGADVQPAFDTSVQLTPTVDVSKIVRVRGRQEISYRSGGRVLFRHSELGARGLTPNLTVTTFTSEYDLASLEAGLVSSGTLVSVRGGAA